MKHFTGILIAVTVVCIVIGLSIHVGAFSSLGGLSLFGKPLFSFGEKSESISVSETYGDIKDINIKDINIDIALSDIRIEEGSEFDVSYEGNEDLAPEVKADGDKLEIIQHDKNLKLSTNYKAITTITVPSSMTLEELECDLDMGDLVIKDISCEKLEITLDAGNADVKDVKTQSIRVDSNMGNIDMVNAEFDKMDIDCDMGNVSVSGVKDLADAKIQAESSMGNIRIDGDKVSNKYSSGNGDKEIRIKTSMGNVDVSR